MDPALAPSAPAELPGYKERAGGARWAVLAGLAFAATCAYLSRVCLSTANTTIQREFGFSPEAMGQILAAFSAGYFWFQIPGGALGSRWGARLVLPLLCVWWSLCAIWTGLSQGFVGLWASRMVSGVAQAGLVPVSAGALTQWFPHSERGVASSAIATCMTAGAVIAASLTALLMPLIGWRWVFGLYAGVGFLWSGLFCWGFRNRPEEHARVGPGELAVIRRDGPPPDAGEAGPLPWRLAVALLGSPGMWLLSLQAFCRAFGAAFFITWFPAYLEKGRGVQLAQAGLLSALPLIGTLLGNAMGGVIVDRLLSRTGNRRLSRCGTSVAALTLCAASLYAATLIGDPTAAVIVIALGSMCFGCGSPAAWATCMDISGRHTPLLMAIQNMTGNLGALVCPMVVGLLIGWIERNQGDWNLVLYLFVAVYLLGALFWAGLNPGRPAVRG
jgi:sugar phosphate permease